jgi:hypothetical protein
MVSNNSNLILDCFEYLVVSITHSKALLTVTKPPTAPATAIPKLPLKSRWLS